MTYQVQRKMETVAAMNFESIFNSNIHLNNLEYCFKKRKANSSGGFLKRIENVLFFKVKSSTGVSNLKTKNWSWVIKIDRLMIA